MRYRIGSRTRFRNLSITSPALYLPTALRRHNKSANSLLPCRIYASSCVALASVTEMGPPLTRYTLRCNTTIKFLR